MGPAFKPDKDHPLCHMFKKLAWSSCPDYQVFSIFLLSPMRIHLLTPLKLDRKMERGRSRKEVYMLRKYECQTRSLVG